jgi:hypothetical protein
MGTSEEITLVGRVLATLRPWSNNGTLNWKYESFIFGAESIEKGEKKVVTPVEISHAYEPNASDGFLPGSFYDHSKLYELHVTRTCGGDETVNDLAYAKVVDGATGRPLPPIKVLRLLKGAPGDLLKPQLLLPCYVLYSDGYRVLSQDKAPRGRAKERCQERGWRRLLPWGV